MTREEIAEMANEAGISTGFVLHIPKWDKATWLFMRRFAVLVAKKEREECAKLADSELRNTTMLSALPPQSSAAWNIAAAIRARGQE
jgi:hypothetical protein